jgi:ParB-like nuclease domain
MARSINIETVAINIDLSRFQFRAEEFSQEKVDWLVANWNKDILDPLDVWQDASGQYWLISGHHRLAAAKQLGYDKILCRVQQGTEDEARILAMASNSNRIPYQPIEYCACVEFLVEKQGMTKAAAADRLTVTPTMAINYYSLRHLRNTDWMLHLHMPHVIHLGYEVGKFCDKNPCSVDELNAIIKLIVDHDLRLPQVQRLITDMRRAKSAAPEAADQPTMFDITAFSANRVAQVIHQRTYFDKLSQRVWFICELLNNPAEGCEIPAEIAEPLKRELYRLNAFMAGEDGELEPVRATAKTGKKMRVEFADAAKN